MPQQTINYLHPIGFEGQVYTENTRAIRGALQELFNGDPVNYLPFGRVVVPGTNPRQAVLPTASAQTPLGVTIQVFMYGYRESEYATGAVLGYPPLKHVNIITMGDVLVYCGNAVNPGDPVYYNYQAFTAPYDQLGRFTNAPATGFAQYPNAKFLKGLSSGGGLVPIGVFGY